MTEQPNSDRTTPAAVLDAERLDPDEFDDSIVGTEGVLAVTGPKQAAWRIETLALGDTMVQWLQEGGPNVYHGSASEDHVSFFVGLSGTPPLNARGAYMAPGHLVVLGPNAPVSSFARGVCTYAGLSLPKKAFLEAAHVYAPEVASHFDGTGMDCTLSMPAWHVILKTLKGTYEVGCSERLPGPATADSLAQELTETFLGAMLDTVHEPKRGRPRIDRARIHRRIEEYLRSAPGPHTVQGLAAHAGVTLRTLQTVCRDLFDTSPKRLLLLEDLRSVRMHLKHPESGATVSEVLSRHGIWHWGRFARRYAQAYGETPSCTLRSA